MHPRGLRCSSLKYSRYCTPPCTTRTVGAPLFGRRATPPGSPRRGLCAVGWNSEAPRPSRDATLSPRAARAGRQIRIATSAVNRMSRRFAAHADVAVHLRDRRPRPVVSTAMRLLAAVEAALIVASVVADGQIPSGPPGRAAISGRVVDGFGDPVVRAHVVVEVRTDGNGTRAVAAGEADDRGEYRIGRLAAGRYVVAVLR